MEGGREGGERNGGGDEKLTEAKDESRVEKDHPQHMLL